MVISAEFTPCKTTALSSSDSVTPHFDSIFDLFDTNAPIMEIDCTLFVCKLIENIYSTVFVV